MGEISLHFILLFLSFQLLSSQLDALLSDGGNAEVLVSEGVDISYHSWISQVQKGIVYYGAVRGRGMKDTEVSIARGGAIKVCMREGTSMERGPIGRGELRLFPLQRDTISNGMIPDEFCDFFLSIFIDKDERIMAGVMSIVFVPSFSRMDGVFVVTDRDV